MLLMLRLLSIKLHSWLAIVSMRSLIYNTRLEMIRIVNYINLRTDGINLGMAVWFFFGLLIISISFLVTGLLC